VAQGQTQWDPPTVLVATQLTQEEKRQQKLEALGLTGKANLSVVAIS